MRKKKVPEYEPMVNFDELDPNFAKAFRKSDFYVAEDDEGEMPFFSETFLYPLVGKDKARAILGYIDRLRGGK